ncbi:hypothetical protein [Nitrolancea hollandica]|uniref:Uncharacterized protein n=1 Tax=Nitrolancea hollandica Lb TaxID=1129897 RepID=I4ELK1_9BACT|nr:hypothetical protein [Nitrolancea hollandica]CCF85563.1 hypothetical protein NITHO_5160007 [Nitrolancea hollandica Lb]
MRAGWLLALDECATDGEELGFGVALADADMDGDGDGALASWLPPLQPTRPTAMTNAMNPMRAFLTIPNPLPCHVVMLRLLTSDAVVVTV